VTADGEIPIVLSSARHHVPATVQDAIEFCFARGWTDGLPVVPPTEALVAEFVALAGRAADEVIGEIPERRAVITVEKAAINAVMAGCRPEYLPAVVAALEGVCDPEFVAHGALNSLSGVSVLLIVSGPAVAALGLNARDNLFGPGNRANATIGRAVMLTLRNVAAMVPVTGFDRATLGHPGKYTYCIAEDETGALANLLHEGRRLRAEESAVSVFAGEAPRQVFNENSRTPEGVLDSVAATIADPGNLVRANLGEYIIVLGGQHREIIARAGWTRTGIQYYLYRHAQLSGAAIRQAGKRPWPFEGEWPSDQEWFPLVAGAESLHLVAAGSHTGGISAVVSPYGGKTSKLVTRRIQIPGG
jgi:hypothetical protein